MNKSTWIKKEAKPPLRINIMLTLNIMKEPVDQTWSIERISKEAVPTTWEAVFEDSEAELRDVSHVLDEQERTYGTYYPLKSDIFNAFHYTPLNSVKVVIIGQDPYHQSVYIDGQCVPRAQGLSFSVRQKDSIPSSLNNIYTELANTVRGFKKPDHGDLREWSRQGILLLNNCLTVRAGTPGSHGDIWLGFINKVFRAIAAVNPYCIFLLWGREAQKVKPMLGDRSIIFEAAHPSGLSARRGFFGCDHFNMVNDALIRQGKVGINWRISSLGELNAPVSSRMSSSTSFNQHNFTPVNVTMLPSIVSKSCNPDISSCQTTPPTRHRKQDTPSQPLLPIIPHTKQQSSSSVPQQPPSDDPTTPQSTSAPPTTVAPLIPSIHFGKDVGATPTISITHHPHVFELPVVSQSSSSPSMIGLPLINPVV